MNIKKILKNRKGSGIMDFFIIMIVTLLVGSAIFYLGAEIKEGIGIGTDKVKTINENMKGAH